MLVRDLDEHLALPVGDRQRIAPVEGDAQLDGGAQATQTGAEHVEQLVHALASGGRDGDRSVVAGEQTAEHRGVLHEIGLVEDDELGQLGRPDLPQHPPDSRHLPLRVGGGGVDDVDEQVGLGDDVQGGLERLDQLVGQLPDEADGVADQHGLPAGQRQAAGGRIERGEEAVLDPHVGRREAVEQRGLAGVRVADDGHPGEAGTHAGLPLDLTMPAHVRQLALEAVDAAHDAAAVDLQLRLARAAAGGADAAGLLAERPAPAAQPGKVVAELRQLDLGLALGAVGVLGEDVQDDRRAVERGAAQQLLEVQLLGRGELVVEHDGVAVDRLRQHPHLFRLAPADVGRGIGALAALDDAGDRVGPGRVDQGFELVEGCFDVIGARRRPADTDEHDALPEGPVDEARGLTAELAERATVRLGLGVRSLAPLGAGCGPPPFRHGHLSHLLAHLFAHLLRVRPRRARRCRRCGPRRR